MSRRCSKSKCNVAGELEQRGPWEIKNSNKVNLRKGDVQINICDFVKPVLSVSYELKGQERERYLSNYNLVMEGVREPGLIGATQIGTQVIRKEMNNY